MSDERRQRAAARSVKPPATSPIIERAVSQDNLSVEQLLAALKRKGIPLPFEIGTFLVLQAAEQALVLEATEQGMAAPPCVGVADVWVTSDGEVSVAPSRAAGAEREACRALVVMLGDLLVRSAPGVPPLLLEIVERGPSDGEWTLMRLRDDLEASLVPLNRGALRRVLARLLREVRREADRTPAAPPPDVRTVDRDLDALFGIESQEQPDSLQPSEPKAAEDDDAGLGGRHEHAATQREARLADDDGSMRERPPPGPGAQRLRNRAARVAPVTASGFDSGDAALDELDAASAAEGRGAVRLGIALALLTAVLVSAFLLMGRERAGSTLGLQKGPAAPAAQHPAAAAGPERRQGELRVTSTPARAQVLLLVGAGPVLATDLPTGVAHEFVAVAEGKAPSRAVVPADVSWQPSGAMQRYELALQLDDASPSRLQDELGAPRLPENAGKPSGALGEVRVVTSPPGARVYRFVGFTPDVRVENVAVGEPLELLVYLSGHVPARVVVPESDFENRDGKLVAELDVELTRKPK